jgi:hypothetical protein
MRGLMQLKKRGVRTRSFGECQICRRRLIVCGTWTVSRRCRVTERASSARARRGRMQVAGLVLLCLAGLGFTAPWAIAQEVAGEYRWRMAMEPTVLSMEQEKAKGGKARLRFQGMCERLPGDDRHPCWQIHYGLAGERVGPKCQ